MYETFQDQVQNEFKDENEVNLVLKKKKISLLDNNYYFTFDFFSESTNLFLGFFICNEYYRKYKEIADENIEHIKKIYRKIYDTLTILNKRGKKIKIKTLEEDLAVLEIDPEFSEFSINSQIRFMEKKIKSWDNIISMDSQLSDSEEFEKTLKELSILIDDLNDSIDLPPQIE